MRWGQKDASGSKIVREYAFDVKAAGDPAEGFFEGYGSVFNVKDSYGDVVMPGAFAKSIATRTRPLPVLWQHRSDSPIGRYLELKEDSKGLWVRGKLNLKLAQAREAYECLADEIVSGMSIGFYVIDESYDEKERVLRLRELDLLECSIVTFPACDPARVEGVKAGHHIRQHFAQGTLPDRKTFEAFLRELGASKSQAVAITNNGLSKLYRGEPGGDMVDEEANPDLMAAIRGLSLNR